MRGGGGGVALVPAAERHQHLAPTIPAPSTRLPHPLGIKAQPLQPGPERVAARAPRLLPLLRLGDRQHQAAQRQHVGGVQQRQRRVACVVEHGPVTARASVVGVRS